MIIEKQPLPEDPTPSDSPPSYDTLKAINASYSSSKISELSPPLSPPIKSPSIASLPSCSSNKGKERAANWFNFSSSRTAREVRNTVLGLIRDLVQEQYSSSSAATSILQSCADASTSHSLSLSSILQERSIENHTPLYWAIVKRLPDEHHQVEDTAGPDLISALLSYSTPLLPETITDVRRACLATCDQRLFQRLRLSPEFAPVSGVDRMLLGITICPDNIEVKEIPGDGGPFVMTFEIPHFHKRMVVSKEICLEFIARNRMWSLKFSIASASRHYSSCRPGSWCVSLSLLETSPPTWIGCRLTIPEAPPLDHHSDRLNSPDSASSQSKPPSNAPTHKPLTLEWKLQSHQQLEVSGHGRSLTHITGMLQDSLMDANLQYEKNPYIGADGVLRGRFEARLGIAPSNADLFANVAYIALYLSLVLLILQLMPSLLVYPEFADLFTQLTERVRSYVSHSFESRLGTEDGHLGPLNWIRLIEIFDKMGTETDLVYQSAIDKKELVQLGSAYRCEAT